MAFYMGPQRQELERRKHRPSCSFAREGSERGGDGRRGALLSRLPRAGSEHLILGHPDTQAGIRERGELVCGRSARERCGDARHCLVSERQQRLAVLEKGW